MKDTDTGVMVTHVEHGSSAEGSLVPGDVLLEVDGTKLANDGSAVFLGQRLAMVAILQARYVGETVPIRLLREGKEMTVDVTLKTLHQLVPRGQYDKRPPFVIIGGLLFQPLSLEYLQSWGGDLKDAPTHLVEQYYDFAEELADDYLVMERGEFIARGQGSDMQANGVRQLVAI